MLEICEALKGMIMIRASGLRAVIDDNQKTDYEMAVQARVRIESMQAMLAEMKEECDEYINNYHDQTNNNDDQTNNNDDVENFNF